VTTATTVALVRGRVPQGAHGLTRRLVLAACGAAVVAGVSSPALAGQGGDLERLAGLPLPDRATAGVRVGHAPDPAAARPTAAPVTRPADRSASTRPAEGAVVVRAGDSLWSLAAARLPASAGPGEVEEAWRAVYAANREEIGADPGLIRPGQRLRLPGTTGAEGQR
jgi:nucleoid-associated protein YgaU